jgi:hypothetical protein
MKSRFRVWWLSGALVVVAAAALLLRLYARPPSRVEVEVADIPRGTEFLCIAAEQDGRMQAMRWYQGSAVAPLLVYPLGARESNLDPRNPQLRPGAAVHWVQADRYGVVMRDGRDRWWVVWLDPAAVRVEGRMPVLGGGHTRIELSQRRRELLSREQLGQMGLGSGWRTE